jgi:glycosyltransferase involved in cell wall biosynthesis
VVIPTYNRAGTVVQAVRSVLAQRYEDLELIVVDDGSTDDTARRLAAIPDERLRYVSGRHAGVSAARNLGVRHATGRSSRSLDSDDRWYPDKLAYEVDVLVGRPDVDAVFSDLEKRHGDQVFPSFMRQTAVFSRRLIGETPGAVHLLDPRDLRLCLLQEVPIKPSALTLRRSAFDRVGGSTRRGRPPRTGSCSCAWPARTASPTSTVPWPFCTSRPIRCMSWIRFGRDGDDPAAHPRAR